MRTTSEKQVTHLSRVKNLLDILQGRILLALPLENFSLRLYKNLDVAQLAATQFAVNAEIQSKLTFSK